MSKPRTLNAKTAFRLRALAAVMTALAALILLCDGLWAYAANTPRQPSPTIQNRSNWCWATTAKLLGERYNNLYRLPGILPKGAVAATNLSGLKDDAIGYTIDGKPTIDAGQQAVVSYVMGADVNNAGTKDQTFTAMRYVTDFHAQTQEQGDYADGGVLLRANWKYPDAALNAGLYVIGNLLITPTFGHSVVIKAYDRSADRFTVYDVWNGETTYATKQKLLKDGFKSSAGTRPISWVYYIINPEKPPKLVSYEKGREAVPTGNLEEERRALKEFATDLSFSGDCSVSGTAPYNYIIYTSVNNGGWYAVRANEDGHYTQFLSLHLKAGDVLRMYCESPSGITTAIQSTVVPKMTARSEEAKR